MSPRQSSNTSSAREPHHAKRTHLYYSEADNKYLRSIKKAKRKTRRGRACNSFDDMEIEPRTDSVDVDDPQAGVQCLTAQDLWADYQSLLQAHRTQQATLQIANGEIRELKLKVLKLQVGHRHDSMEIEAINGALDSARASLLDAEKQIAAAQRERDSAQASLMDAKDQVESARRERDLAQASLMDAKDQVESARDSAQASLMDAEDQVKSARRERDSAQASLLDAAYQIKLAQDERDSAQGILKEARTDLSKATKQIKLVTSERETERKSAESELTKVRASLLDEQAKQHQIRDELTARLDVPDWSKQHDYPSEILDFLPSATSMEWMDENYGNLFDPLPIATSMEWMDQNWGDI